MVLFNSNTVPMPFLMNVQGWAKRVARERNWSLTPMPSVISKLNLFRHEYAHLQLDEQAIQPFLMEDEFSIDAYYIF